MQMISISLVGVLLPQETLGPTQKQWKSPLQPQFWHGYFAPKTPNQLRGHEVTSITTSSYSYQFRNELHASQKQSSSQDTWLYKETITSAKEPVNPVTT